MGTFAPWRSEMIIPDVRVNVGALVFTSIAEMTERGRPTNQGIDGLYRDVRNTLVYADPTTTRATAADARAKADTIEPALPTAAADLRKIAARLDEEAAAMEVRAKGMDAPTVARQVSFSQSYFTFKNSWDDYYGKVKSGEAFDTQSGNDIAASIDSYDAQYRTAVQGYKDLGFKPASPPPPKSNAGDTLPDVNASVKGFFDAIPWGTIAIVGVVGVGGYVAYKLLSTKTSDTPNVTIVNTEEKKEVT